jgi:hypothetical protein
MQINILSNISVNFGEDINDNNLINDFPVEIHFDKEKDKELVSSFPIGSVLTIEGGVVSDRHHNRLITFISESLEYIWPDSILPYSGNFKVTITRDKNNYNFESKELFPHSFTQPFSNFDKLYIRNGYYIKSIVFKI